MLDIIGHQGSANQTAVRYTSRPVGWLESKKTDNNKCWRECGEVGTSYIAGAAAVGNSWAASQKVKHRITM